MESFQDALVLRLVDMRWRDDLVLPYSDEVELGNREDCDSFVDTAALDGHKDTVDSLGMVKEAYDHTGKVLEEDIHADIDHVAVVDVHLVDLCLDDVIQSHSVEDPILVHELAPKLVEFELRVETELHELVA